MTPTIRVVLLTVLCGLLIAPAAFAADEREGGVFVEMAVGKSPAAIWAALGGNFQIDDQLSANASVYFLTTENLIDTDYYHTGIQVGGRYALQREAVSPFIGIGGIAGYNEETVRADNDSIDNDNDGLIDEFGEERTLVSNQMAALFPEVGFEFWFDDDSKLTLSARYFFTTEGRDYDFWLFGAALQF